MPLARLQSGQIVIVDATGLISQRHKTANEMGSPRDHAAILKDVWRFAAREGIRFQLVFTGRPLREAAEGVEQKGVVAYYVETRDACKATILRLVKDGLRKNNVVVCASDPQVEAQSLELHAECMRPLTLKKAFDEKDEKTRPATRKPNGRREDQRPPEPEKPDAPPQDTREAAVLTLIDPV